MPLKITINKATETPPPPKKKLLITIRKKEQLIEPDAQASLNLKARRTLDGSVLITDHPLIDILIQPSNQKIVSFAKKNFGDEIYNAQSRLFDYLQSKGVVLYDTIQGGNVYGTIQAKYPEAKDQSALEAVLLSVGKWVNEEKAAELEMKSYEQEVEDLFLNPPEEDSTELGETPPIKRNDPERYYQSRTPTHGNISGYSE